MILSLIWLISSSNVGNVKFSIVLVFAGKDFLGQLIKVEFAEKRVPKGGFGRGGGRGAAMFYIE